MIKDDRHYQNVQSWVQNFEQALAQLERNENERVKDNSQLREIYMNEVQRKLDDLREEIREYETITNHDERTPIVLELDDINNLPQLLIKGRMAAKLSQKELADLAGLTEEQIQQYEEKDYEDASFIDVMAVVDALDIKVVKGEFLIPLDTLRRTPITKEELLSKPRQKVSS
ncbi:helix-turn-helix transcriptional regulator [Planktothrix sp. FACHB-1375]|uniref:Helix-turn-helix transcriptional regulator n=2 Tax=Aerosakkonema funiforme TaxID=1246630 RepID=A0A926ZKJ8_9CYAN|nr:helix-turn-helix transcriptional regulator [Aerosakkonema funiforme FACHB-1375]